MILLCEKLSFLLCLVGFNSNLGLDFISETIMSFLEPFQIPDRDCTGSLRQCKDRHVISCTGKVRKDIELLLSSLGSSTEWRNGSSWVSA